MTIGDIRGGVVSFTDPVVQANPNPDLAWKAPVRVATTGSNINLQTIGLGTIDGVTLNQGDRVLVKDQTDQTTNGIYNATTGPWVRTIDASSNAQWTQGLQVMVALGTINANTPFTCTTPNLIILGTSNITFQGSFTTSIAANSITNAKLAQAGALTFKGNVTTSTGNETDNALIVVNPVWFGADPTGTSDSSAALTAALAASNYVAFPPGKFKFNSAFTYSIPSGIKSVTIVGAGQDVTTLAWPNASGGMTFNYAGFGSSVHIRDLTLTTGTTTGGTAITLASTVNNNNSIFADSDITRVTCRGDDGYYLTDYWTTCIAVQDVSNVDIDDVFLAGSSTRLGTGVSIIGQVSSSTYAVAVNVDGSFFNFLTTGILYNSFVQGVSVNQTNFLDVINGITSNASEGGTLDQLSITNSQWNSVVGSGNGINLNTAVAHVMIATSYFICNGATCTGVNIQLAQSCMIIGNSFLGNGSSSQVGLNLVNTNAAPCAIVGNFFNQFSGASSKALILGASSSLCSVVGNGFANCTSTLVNAGTNNVAIANPGLNPVGTAGAVVMGASPFTYTAGAYFETHYVRQFATNTASISKAAQQIANLKDPSTYYVVELGPNESYTTVWATDAPQYTKDVH